MINKIIQGDTLEKMKLIESASVDMILADLPYGTTACSWDEIIPFDKLWEQYNRVIKSNAAIVLTGSEPFSSKLRMSNIDNYKYDWIYQKSNGSNFAVLKYQPMKEHEDVMVFSKNTHNYYPIKEERKGSGAERVKYMDNPTNKKSREYMGGFEQKESVKHSELRYPSSIQKFVNTKLEDRGSHPTQKPVALFEYLIKTYTKENELVLDNTIGSGTTAIACLNTNRNFIGIEKEQKYVDIANERIANSQIKLFI